MTSSSLSSAALLTSFGALLWIIVMLEKRNSLLQLTSSGLVPAQTSQLTTTEEPKPACVEDSVSHDATRSPIVNMRDDDLTSQLSWSLYMKTSVIPRSLLGDAKLLGHRLCFLASFFSSSLLEFSIRHFLFYFGNSLCVPSGSPVVCTSCPAQHR